MAPMKSPLTVQCPLNPAEARAFVAELMKDHGDAIAKVFQRFGLPASDADDANHQFFLRASEAATNWNSPPENFRAWCCKVARWVALDWLEERSRRNRLPNAYARSGMARKEFDAVAERENAAARAKVKAVQAAFRLLPPELADVAEKYYIDQCTHREIADELRIKERRVRRQLTVIRQRLQATLEPLLKELLD